VSTAEVVSPYIAARHEWDERYGSLITQAHNWRVAFQVASVIALVAVAGATWLSVHSRTKVFVVALDHLGRSVAAGYADQTSVTNDDRGDDRAFSTGSRACARSRATPFCRRRPSGRCTRKLRKAAPR